jgi:mRNA interferase RelE/StbE
MSDGQPYQLYLTDVVERQLARLDKTVTKQIMKKLLKWAERAEAVQHEALTGQWSSLYRVRIGDYRAIYDLKRNERILLVVKIGHRREIYDA